MSTGFVNASSVDDISPLEAEVTNNPPVLSSSTLSDLHPPPLRLAIPPPLPLPDFTRGRVVHGTCGWSDTSAPWNSANKLSSSALHRHSHGYQFGCVEIDSTTYNYPSLSSVRGWIASTPPQFVFHVKLFGFLCSRGGDRRKLPQAVRDMLPNAHNSPSWIRMCDMPTAALCKLWELSNAMLEPLIRADRLGCVLLQFHTGFGPTPCNEDYVRQCRQKLRGDARMCVEFRDRAWIPPADGPRLSHTADFLRGLPACLVASDDLLHEVAQRDRDQRGMPEGGERVRLRPVLVPGCLPELIYCRVHRRHGTQRILRDDELADWVNLLVPALANVSVVGNASTVEGGADAVADDGGMESESPQPVSLQTTPNCYFLWGTDHKDQSVLNSRMLNRLLPEAARVDWQAEIRRAAKSKKGSLLSMLSSPLSSTKTATVQVSALSSPSLSLTLVPASSCVPPADPGSATCGGAKRKQLFRGFPENQSSRLAGAKRNKAKKSSRDISSFFVRKPAR